MDTPGSAEGAPDLIQVLFVSRRGSVNDDSGRGGGFRLRSPALFLDDHTSFSLVLALFLGSRWAWRIRALSVAGPSGSRTEPPSKPRGVRSKNWGPASTRSSLRAWSASAPTSAPSISAVHSDLPYLTSTCRPGLPQTIFSFRVCWWMLRSTPTVTTTVPFFEWAHDVLRVG